MHELPVTQSILDLALTQAQQSGAQRITGVNLVIGALSHEADDSIRFYWEMLSVGTPAQGAQLHFRRIPAELRCLDCNTLFPTHEVRECPACLSPRVAIHSGDDLRVESIDVD